MEGQIAEVVEIEVAKQKILSAADIFAVEDREIIDIPVPEWKGTLRLQALTAAEAIEFTNMADNPATKQNAFVRIVALCAVDENRKRLFTDADMQKLRTKSAKIFMRLQEAALKLNGWDKASREAAKNASGEAATVASPTESPAS